jgi:DNA-binding beta-propeller fold protein YncE
MKLKLSVVCALLVLTATLFAADQPKYQVLQHYVLGGDGGWDYLTVDSANHRIFISRATHVLVVDSETGKQIGDIPNTNGVHGIALVPKYGKGFISNGRAGTITIFDLKTLKATGEAKAGTNPDAIMYDPASHRVFAFNGRSQDATVIDAEKGTVAGTIPLGGRPEFGVSNGKGKVFVNLEDKSEIVAIDAQKMTVLSHWSLAPCEEPSGLAIDQKNSRLFSVCSNKMMAAVNADSGKLITTVPTGNGTDAAGFDPDRRLVFSSNGEGTLTIIHQDSPDKYSVVQNVETARGARTMALDPATHKVYLVTAKFGPPPAATAEQPHPRPAILPNTFELMVVGQK